MQSYNAAGTAVPAATPVEIAERVEGDDHKSARSMSPKSFNSDEIFDDVDMECGGEERISDHDLDRLLDPLPLRRALGAIDNNRHSLETESASSDRRKKRSKGLCPCCPQVVQRGPWQCIAAVTGRDGSVPTTRVGNMIVILPKCFHVYGFGIMGPHWFGPVCCVGLLTGATFYFGRKAYHTIGIGSAAICLLFYITALVSLFIVSCSDPGVVKADSRYEGVPSSDVSASRGWRYCDLCCIYQPPGAVHCPDCNVCIEGYDHHCPWMGTCIGKKNFTSFMTFNLTWLFYFLYAIIWVSFVGAAFYDPYTRIDSSSDD